MINSVDHPSGEVLQRIKNLCIARISLYTHTYRTVKLFLLIKRGVQKLY